MERTTMLCVACPVLAPEPHPLRHACGRRDAASGSVAGKRSPRGRRGRVRQEAAVLKGGGMNDVQGRLDAGEVVILDGAMGTELQRRGVPMDDVAWDAAALDTHPDLVREDYIEAGAEVIITNTFATARHVLEPAGMGGQFRALNMRAVTLAKEARENVADGSVFIAGSISTMSAHDDHN